MISLTVVLSGTAGVAAGAWAGPGAHCNVPGARGRPLEARSWGSPAQSSGTAAQTPSLSPGAHAALPGLSHSTWACHLPTSSLSPSSTLWSSPEWPESTCKHLIRDHTPLPSRGPSSLGKSMRLRAHKAPRDFPCSLPAPPRPLSLCCCHRGLLQHARVCPAPGPWHGHAHCLGCSSPIAFRPLSTPHSEAFPNHPIKGTPPTLPLSCSMFCPSTPHPGFVCLLLCPSPLSRVSQGSWPILFPAMPPGPGTQ